MKITTIGEEYKFYFGITPFPKIKLTESTRRYKFTYEFSSIQKNFYVSDSHIKWAPSDVLDFYTYYMRGTFTDFLNQLVGS